MKRLIKFSFGLLFIIFGCKHHDKIVSNTNQEIYDFMLSIVTEQNLNRSYGISINPESNFDVWKSDETNFEFRITEINEKIEIEDSLNLNNLIHKLNETSFKFNVANLLSNFSEEDVNGMISQKENLELFQWDNSRLGFNSLNNSNWYSFSIPLFSKDKNTAIIMIKDLCPGLCGNGKTIVFTKKNGNWISQNVRFWLH